MSKTVVLGVVFVVAVIAFLIYSSLNLAQYRVEVCMAFNGRTSCRIASAVNQAEALRSAQSNACALIASGVTDTMACERSEPASTRWLEKR